MTGAQPASQPPAHVARAAQPAAPDTHLARPRPLRAPCLGRVAATATVIAALATLSGCSGSAVDSSQNAGAYAPAPGAAGTRAQPPNGAPSTGMGGTGGPGGPAGTSGNTTGTAAPDTRVAIGGAGSAIERAVNAAFTVPAGSFLSSFEGVTARAVGMGGYLLTSSTQPDGEGRIVSGVVSVKIPAAKLADFLNGLPSTFKASSINFASIDHTAAFIDVNARLTSAHAHLSALNALLARANSLGDVTTLEQQVANVQAEVDTEQGQLNVLDASVALATATLQLSERGAVVAPASPPSPVTSGVGSGWSNAVAVTGAVLEGVVTALPLLALALFAWLLWRGLSRTARPWRRPKRSPG